MVQGEPTEEDIVIHVDGTNFAVEAFYETVIENFEVDYTNGVFRKGFVVYPNGRRSSC